MEDCKGKQVYDTSLLKVATSGLYMFEGFKIA